MGLKKIPNCNDLLKENTNLKQALNEIAEIIERSKGMDFQKEKYILQIINKVLGDDEK